MSVQKKKGTRKKSLGRKLVGTIIILSASIMLIAVALGVWQFTDSTISRYKEEAYQIAAVAADDFYDYEFEDYAKAIEGQIAGDITTDSLYEIAKTDAEYFDHLERLEEIRVGMEVNDVAIIYLKPNEFENYDENDAKSMDIMPMHYIFDSYYDPALQFSYGDSWSVKQKYGQSIYEAIVSGKDPSISMISKGSFGFTISAVHPVLITETGTICSFIEIPMSTLISDVVSYVLWVIAIVLVITVAALIVAIKYTMNNVLSPIDIMADEAEAFAMSSDASKSESLAVSEILPTIKTGDELETLSDSILKMEIGINEYIDNITRITAEKERIGAELNVATQIQADMLPSIFPPFPDRNEFEIFASMDPAKEVGGDFYDFYLLDRDHLVMTIADVSGKGVPAALFMVISKTLLKNAAQQGLTPHEILERVNDQLDENNTADMFVTVWIGIMQISTGHVVAANAGHEYPTLRAAGGNYEIYKDKHGLPLGAMGGVKYKEYEFDIEDGGSLYVYTDGVAEATNSSDELYGTDRMVEALNREADANPETLLKNVKEDIDAFVKEAPQFDDITMLALRRVNA